MFLCAFQFLSCTFVYVKYLFRYGNFSNENYPPPPPINLIFLVCCYSLSFHLNNNSNILACYIYICTHVSSPFLLILGFFCMRFVKNIPVFKKYIIIVLICKEHNIPVCTYVHVHMYTL